MIRAGGGSPRDTLSVLDQLLAGADDNHVAYQRALALLGATDVALIDEAVDALAAGDAAALFGAVESVIDAGHDPRRFATDLLERFRDLIVLQAVPDAAARGVVDAPEDVLERMREQAARVGTATLTRYAEVVHAGLGEMRGATAPRLLLEVVCARLLLPSASDTESALLQRIERIETRLDMSIPADESAPAPGRVRAASSSSAGQPGTAAARAPHPNRTPAPRTRHRAPAPAAANRARARPATCADLPTAGHSRRCLRPLRNPCRRRARSRNRAPEPVSHRRCAPAAPAAQARRRPGRAWQPANPMPPRSAPCGPRCGRRCERAAPPR